MSHSLIFVVAIQVLLAITFFIVPFVARRYGDKAQQEAEEFVKERGVSSQLLARSGFRVAESRAEMMLPLATGVVFAALAIFNVLGAEIGRTLSLVIHSLFFFVGGLTTAGQVFVAQYTQMALSKISDEKLRNIDAKSLVAVANAAFPVWLRPLIITRFLLVTAGSVAVVLLIILNR